MTAMMIGALLLLAVAATAQPASPAEEHIAPFFQPTGGATARATVSIRVLNGASFGAGYSATVSGADRRSTEIADSEGPARPAELLEFQ